MVREERLRKILSAIPELSDSRLKLVDEMIAVLELPTQFLRNPESDIISDSVLVDFGDILRVHHSHSREPFSKDKFEYALEKVLQSSNISATLADRGQRGFDITIKEQRFSLKTEAAKAIKLDKLHISKFMELGGGNWRDNPSDLSGLLEQFLTNIESVERILSLRALSKNNPFIYELVEIPKLLLQSAESGVLEMRSSSAQFPKPGYCYVPNKERPFFSLYFDGGGERKLQIKGLHKSKCIVHATWRFALPD